MVMQHEQFQILSILCDNLATPHPQLVPTATISRKIGMERPKLLQLMRYMNGKGTIQSTDDLRFTLITNKGLEYLNKQERNATGISSKS